VEGTLDRSEVPVHAGERIRAVRLLVGISPTDLAASLGVTQALISQIESGRRAANARLLDQVAEVTGYPRSFFESVPPDLPPLSLRFRRKTTVRSSAVHRVEQLVAETYRVVWQLVRDRGRYIPPSLPLASSDTITAEDIESLAMQAREALGLDPSGPVRHVTRTLERGGMVVVPLALAETDEDCDTVGHFGVSCWPGAPDPAVIGYFEGGTGDRQRFTLAHELGHLVLHTRRRFVHDHEDEANRFASAFLVPRDRAQEFFATHVTLRDLAQLKAAWGVSIQALIMRGNQLGLIDPARTTSLFKQLSARGWRKSEPVRVHLEAPALFAKLLEDRFGHGASGYRRAADVLGLPAFVLGTLAPMTRTPSRG
jgi:Zn-dependent peptidase ImmA (M78 family)/DNA-binding XRE family transcriptional regulator